MNEEVESETYLKISNSKFEIYLYDKTNYKNLYKNEINFSSENQHINFNILNKFLKENIFKIEKLTGKFIKNIFLILNNYEIFKLKIGIKKKNYKKVIDKNFLESTLIEAKDLYKESYQDYKIMHMIIESIYINGKYLRVFQNDFKNDYLSLEVEFIAIPNSLADEIDKILESYQVKIDRYLDENYILNLFSENKSELSRMANQMMNGFNENEVMLLPKNVKKLGFFEKFFQLFS